ncbi:MAG: hypothetical protein K6T75_05995, partial [Acetobacteraceae bacterium]|nr:hypothetical protein [Acetobacteraceae bacterium]
GLERVIMLLEEQGRLMRLKAGLDAFLVTAGPGMGRAAFGLLQRLRRCGVAADMDWLGRSTRAQMKQADRASARWVVLLGEDEVRRGVLLLRDMASGEQRELPPHDVVEFLRRSRAAGGRTGPEAASGGEGQ